MEDSASCWFTDSAIEDLGIIHQWELDPLNQLIIQNTWEGIRDSEFTCIGPTDTERPRKLPKTDSWGSCTDELTSTLAPRTSSNTLSFDSQGSSSEKIVGVVEPRDVEKTLNSRRAKKKMASVAARPPGIQDNVLAERKRREKLNKRFIALSAVVPDLTRMDKASILEDAINYVKLLQEKVRNLENQADKRGANSDVVVQKNSEGDQPSDEKNRPEIEARLLDGSVLVRIHCENRKGLLVKVLSEIEDLNLTVTNTSVIPFASSFDMTVRAQIEEGFSMEAKDLVKKLNSAFEQLRSRMHD